MTDNPENKNKRSLFISAADSVRRAFIFIKTEILQGLIDKSPVILGKFSDFIISIYDKTADFLGSQVASFKETGLFKKLSGLFYKIFNPVREFSRRHISPVYEKYSGRIEKLSAQNYSVLVVSLFILNLLLVWLISYQVLFARYYWEGEDEKRFRVRYGSSLTEIAGELEGNDIIKNATVFKLVVKLSGNEENIISRTYLFRNGMSNAELLKIMTDKSLAFTIRFTVLEGMRMSQIGRLCESRIGLSYEEFMKQASSDSLISVLGFGDRIKNLEGFLFPDTYFIPVDITEKEIVTMLFNEFRKKVLNNETLMQAIDDNNSDLLNIITLASIVQGETQMEEEMPVIAGVYFNRLSKRMRLEADPTVQYVIPGGPKERLLKDDLKIDSPYNTYRKYGLPPGPINNPGLDAIKAAVFPEKNDYLFFVATGRGGHKFAVTYNEHLKNVEEYRKIKGQK